MKKGNKNFYSSSVIFLCSEFSFLLTMMDANKIKQVVDDEIQSEAQASVSRVCVEGKYFVYGNVRKRSAIIRTEAESDDEDIDVDDTDDETWHRELAALTMESLIRPRDLHTFEGRLRSFKNWPMGESS